MTEPNPWTTITNPEVAITRSDPDYDNGTPTWKVVWLATGYSEWMTRGDLLARGLPVPEPGIAVEVNLTHEQLRLLATELEGYDNASRSIEAAMITSEAFIEACQAKWKEIHP